MEMVERFSRLDAFISEGRLLRKQWTGTDAAGREMACLLAALSPEVAADKSPDACPAGLMPTWWARMTVWLDDYPSVEAWPEVIRRYAGLARRWHVLDAETWRRLSFRVGAVIVREARQHTNDKKTLAAVDGVLALLDRASSGGKVSRDEWSAAQAAAAWSAQAAAAQAARAAAQAAAQAAAERAAWSAQAAWSAAAQAAWSAAAEAAAAEAADRIATSVLDVTEAAVIEREKAA